jgi:hypothetical protein
MKEKHIIGSFIEELRRGYEQRIKIKKDIQRMRDIFDELDIDAKHSLQHVIEYLLYDEWWDAEVHYKDGKIKNKINKIIKILLWLPEKTYLRQSLLLKEKIDTQDKLIEALEYQEEYNNTNTDVFWYDIRSEK